ncbi:MAG: YqiA/YcfP family alpha/beta fold hydrolase, partial [Coleofasciculaceae cyanobacterium]
MNFIYLHGFASCPESAKAIYLVDKLSTLGISLQVPNLNQDDFSHLTITRQIEQVMELFESTTAPITLIGSSLGGLTAAWLGQKNLQVQKLILLAPAFGFLDHWLPKLGDVQLREWQQSGSIPVYHYCEKRTIPLHYQFVEDAHQYQEIQ